ncbi:group III truncated hemoglobin [Novosphingobium umbonatum]|uniref:Group III truncated hemoglobin n=1 Tax=Novosphingobium umbonatum TaxID=1908524 RepID=A0A3S2X7X0_9SPHN|nr:group III truncated hemoglobin [Novosphingobium umbonatum]
MQERHPDLARLVEHFYGQARQDLLLGPIFADRVEDWPHHLRALTAFWAAQLRGRGSYRGTPLAAHRAMASRLSPAHFARWLELWDAATVQVMGPDDAMALQTKACRIASVLQAAVLAP